MPKNVIKMLSIYLERQNTILSILEKEKLAGAEENDIHYFMGCAYEGLGDKENAELYFRKATVGSAEPAYCILPERPTT